MRYRDPKNDTSSRSSYSRNGRGKSDKSKFSGNRKQNELPKQRRPFQESKRSKHSENFNDHIGADNSRRSLRFQRANNQEVNSDRSQRKIYSENSKHSLRRYNSRFENKGTITYEGKSAEKNSSQEKNRVRNDDFAYGKKDQNSQASPQDIFWGRHATYAILESGRPLHRIWCTTEIRTSNKFLQLLRDAKAVGVLVEEVSWARLGHLTNGGVHQGIALQTAASETFDLKVLINGCNSLSENPLLLALDGITDPHNLGAIVRSAEALGAHGLILPQRRSAGLTGSVAKVAAGALEHLPVARVVNLNRALEHLKKVGYRIIGLAEEGTETINQLFLDGPLVVVIGSEGKGLSVLTRRNCDQLIRIPLRGVTSNLNASVASSIFLYEVARKGWMNGISGNDPSPKLSRLKLSKVLET